MHYWVVNDVDEIRTSNKITGEKKTNVAVEMSIRHLRTHPFHLLKGFLMFVKCVPYFLGGWSIIYTCITLHYIHVMYILYSSFLHFTRQ